MTFSSPLPTRMQIIDSHTAGEPTRCVLSGMPDLGSGPMAERLEILRCDFDHYRRAILCEPRGSEVLVGAYLVAPVDPTAAAGVIFFNNAGYLGMCGHGMIGVAATLAYIGRIKPGGHLIETPVGNVKVHLAPDGEVTIANVESYRYRRSVPVEIVEYGTVRGDIAWGGNWFYLIEDHPFTLTLANEEQLTSFTWHVRQALIANGITGADGAEIDHIELFTAPHDPANHSRNYVLCPGKVYDRSPCGTGTSAKMACLAADGKLAPGHAWRQEGILDTVFTGHIELDGTRVLPSISGAASITAEATLIFQADDPFRYGIGVGNGIA